jgi:hypothetical protein
VPAYNERDQIDTLLERIFAVYQRHQLTAEVIIGDDNLGDSTGPRADDWANHTSTPCR